MQPQRIAFYPHSGIMEQPPPSHIMLQAEASSAPPYFQPISAASILNGMLRAYHSKPEVPLSIGIPSIDSLDGVLGGGIPQSCVIGLSSDLSEGSGRTFALRLLIRDLLRFENRHKRAMVIDSTGTFPLATLLEIIKRCVGEINDGTTKTSAGQRMPWREKVIVEGLLERIGITRVFDLEGVWDVIGEIRAGRYGGDGKEEEERGGGEEENGVDRAKQMNGMSPVTQGRAQEFVEEYAGFVGSTLGVGNQQVEERQDTETEESVRIETTEEQLPLAQSVQHSPTEAFRHLSQDTQPAQIPATPSSISTPAEGAALPTSSPLSPPPPSEEPQTSSPLSSLPNSPSLPHSASSSSLRSELVIEPSPVKERANTVLSQAYQGEGLPPPTPSLPSSEPVVMSPSPVPPSSPPMIQPQVSAFSLPTEGFETHLATDAQRQNSDSDSDTDTSSDTSSYLRGQHAPTPFNKELPSSATRWQDSKSAAPPSLLLIDSLPPLLTQLFGTGSTDRTAAHKEWAQLSRVLTQMSRSTVCALTVILLNSTTVPNAAKSLDKQLMCSIFADSKTVPSFGAVYDGMCDISLLISKVPRTQDDAKALYGGYGEHCSYTHVVECLRDDVPDLARWMEAPSADRNDAIKGEGRIGKRMNREGRWGSFDVLRLDGEVMVRGLEMERKLGEYRDLGFGRRL